MVNIKVSDLWPIILLIIPRISGDEDDFHLELFSPEDVANQVKEIITAASPVITNLHYDSIANAAVHDAVIKALQDLSPLNKQLLKVDMTGREQMCGFDSIFTDFKDMINKIEENFNHLQRNFYRFITSRHDQLLIPNPINNNDIVTGTDICKWLTFYSTDNIVANAQDLHYSFTSPDAQRFLVKMWNNFRLTVSSSYCGTGGSLQTYTFGLLTRILSALYKEFIMQYTIQQFYNVYLSDTDCTENIRHHDTTDYKAQLKSNILEVIRVYQMLLISVPNKIIACDSTQLIRDENFIELEGAFQSIVLPSNYEYKSHYCADIKPMQSNAAGFYDNYCDDNHICLSLLRPCTGEIYNCISGVDYPTDRDRFCELESGPRRYLWINYYDADDDKYTGGDNNKCLEIKGTPKNTSGGYTKSQVCLCVCNDNHVNSLSTHVVSLMPVEADYKDNKIVTGIKFIILRRILYLQIEQGVLTPGLIVTDREWKAVDDISERVLASRLGTPGKSQLQADKDYLILTRDTRDKFDLGLFNVSKNEVVTGIQFYLAKDRLKFKVIGRSFDAATGKICQKCLPKYYYSDVPNGEHENVAGTSPLVEQSAYKKYDFSDHFVTFHASSPIHDSGQTTMPYFDAVPVTTEPPAPIRGVAMFLKLSAQSIGLIYIQLTSFDYFTYVGAAVKKI